MDAPEAIQWLSGLGVEFDKAPDGTMITTHGGGTSRKRMHAAKDYSGAEIMRTLRDEVLNRGIPVVDFTSAIELIKDENGHCAGAILLNMETKELLVAKAKTVILATGGAGRLHYQGFPTSNHDGATADGIVMGYRAGAKLIYIESVQFHPTGTAWPEQLLGLLSSEALRAQGTQVLNVDGQTFAANLETRDALAAAIIRECNSRGKGVETPAGIVGAWLDTPLIDMIHGPGTFQRRFAGIYSRFMGYGINPLEEPILVYPTQHYQTIGVIGGTGSGKSSLVNLIPRFYDATEGSVEIFGRPVASYPRDALRGRVAVVMQKAQLFGGTIRSNLLWGNKNATDADLWAALETAQAADFVRAKPLGLDEPVEQGGRNLSGGQKQRLTIARALVGKPDILILDDSASALDYATDAALRKALAALPGALTVFIVSQRAASLQHADQILVLDDGHLVGIGTHSALRSSCPVYEEIYESQFKKGEAEA